MLNLRTVVRGSGRHGSGGKKHEPGWKPKHRREPTVAQLMDQHDPLGPYAEASERLADIADEAELLVRSCYLLDLL